MSMPKLHILLVDDKLSMLKIQHGLLNRFGHSVVAVSSASEAITILTNQLQKANFDLVLMDMQMPEIDGLEAARMLRSRGVTTPILALTGNDCDDHRKEAAEAGMNGYLTKPLNETKLSSAWVSIN
ncbi:histidine kinase [Thiomicrospira aerophila AL3]|uniref:Histidine kinase n=1 Tax=Thiomicrospira aerophila AL3 TaxID=717772 RepID=W0DQ72_9GAMM|nr:response regulator [Thiomicrospira aerophila]AHF00735.1 histidine kinase [Thiomicrospira aerophila AL3]